MDIANLKKILIIDRLNLEKELQEQPSIFFDIATQCAEAISERDKEKEERDRVWAKAFLTYKSTILADGKYPTDTATKSLADSSDDYREATDRYLGAKEKADILIGLKDALQERAVMLRELCGLWTTGYYQDISVSK